MTSTTGRVQGTVRHRFQAYVKLAELSVWDYYLHVLWWPTGRWSHRKAGITIHRWGVVAVRSQTS